jgi:Xaa-Pro aminopeptidase
MVYEDRITTVRNKIEELGLDAILFTNLINIRYLCGYSGSNGLLFVSKKASLFLTDFRYKTQIETEVKAAEGIVPEDGLLLDALVARPEATGIYKLGFESSIAFDRLESMKRCFPETVQWTPVENFVAQMRCIKTSEEVEKVKKAIVVAETGLRESLDYLRPGITEMEFAAELEYRMRKHGAEKPAFDTIVVSGERSALIHGIASPKVIAHGDLVTIDYGAKVDGYHSDITRTFIMGEPSPKQREIYELVYLAQTSTVKGVRAGLPGKEIDGIARKIIEDAGYGEYFGHGLGHGLGMEVHDNLGVGSKSENIIPKGAIITVEPGVYIPGIGGVRIEDDVLVEESGASVLTTLPKDIDNAIIE